jgi:hypothetical protein
MTRRFASAVQLAALAVFSPAHALNPFNGISYFRYTQPVRMDLLLPFDGPGSAILNPARLADGERLYAQFGTRKTGDSRALDLSMGAGLFKGFYLGAFFAGASGQFDFSNAVILDNRFGFQAAYQLPLDAEGKGHVSFGLADTYRQVNLLNAFKATRFTPDLGLVFVPSAYPGGWKLEFGWAARDLRGLDEMAPANDTNPNSDPYSHVDFAPWLTTGSVSASSPARLWSFFAEGAAGARYEPAYFDKPLAGWNAAGARLYLPRIGAAFHPVAPVSLGLERVWGRYWALNTTLGTGNWLPVRCEADFRAAYGPYLQYRYPDHTGWSLAWNLRVVW